jgi:hypothetical protein
MPRPSQGGHDRTLTFFRALQFLSSCKGSFEIRPTLNGFSLGGLKSQLVIHSPESKIEYSVLPRVKNNIVMGVADEDAPEEPQR